MRVGTRSAISTFASLAIVVALAGCSGAKWQFWKTSPAETPSEPAVATAPEPSGATQAPTAAPMATARPAPTETAAAPVASSNGFTERAELGDVRFRPGQVTIVKADHQALDGVVRWLKAHPHAVVMIEGHTDDQGTRESNVAAGEKRAVSIRSYLMSKGIEATRIAVASVGSDRPLCVEKTDTCRAKNRRARFLVRQ
jgi:peptidoglycan-associated lipoprotein